MAGTTISKDLSSQQAQNNQAKRSLNSTLNTMLEGEGLKKRFEELLGKRMPQFMSSLVSLLNATPQLQDAFFQSPMTIIQSALKAATFDLPIDPNLGFAYIVPFNNKQPDGSYKKEATFIMGYKGMQQLALRTGAYKTLNVIDVKEGELVNYNRLTEEIELEFIEDDDEREKAKTIGYVGYFKLINGTEKTIYMSVKQIESHEKKHRKGQYMGKGWKNDFEAMCTKTVMRKLIGKWGLMSIDYQQATPSTVAAAEAIATGQFDSYDEIPETIQEVEYSEIEVDEETGEVSEEQTTL